MLDIVVPTTFIGAAIRPDHLSFTVALIVSVLTDVLCATVPNKVTLPITSVLRKLTFVCVALLSAVAAPLSKTVLLPLVELSRIVSSAFP
jgi:Flp pilus assembly protein protease CpaA